MGSMNKTRGGSLYTQTIHSIVNNLKVPINYILHQCTLAYIARYIQSRPESFNTKRNVQQQIAHFPEVICSSLP